MSEVAAQAAVENSTALIVDSKVPTQTPEHIDKFASKFAALTRKEKESAEKWKAKDTEYAAKLAEISTDKRKALDFILSKGLTIDEIGQMLMDEANPDPEQKLKRSVSDTESRLMKEIQALKQSLEDKDSRKIQEDEESAKKQHEKVVQGVMTDLTDFVNKTEDYELIRTYNSVDMVYNVMNEHYMEQVNKGIPDQLIKILTYKDACDAVESHLDEQVKKVYEAKRAKQVPKQEQKDPKTTQTLSNTLSSEVPSSGDRKLSNDELIKEAAKQLRWRE
jgi:hypothetical protein